MNTKNTQLRRIYMEHTTNGHHKFYEMIENVDDTFVAKYGKIGTSGSSDVYRDNMWEIKFVEKLNKGYVVVSDDYYVKNADNVTTVEIDTMIVKLRILSSTISEVLSMEPNTTLSSQLNTVNKIMDRIRLHKLILATDLKYCNNLFKKTLIKRKKLNLKKMK